MPSEQENLKMPPEQESLNRQLEALGRYVADLQHQREGAKDAAAQPPPVPEPRRLSRRWLLLTSLLVVLALGVAWRVAAAADPLRTLLGTVLRAGDAGLLGHLLQHPPAAALVTVPERPLN
jgi:hypothetical protein